MPPEPQAYALARYSRSADPISESLAWVHDHSSERFWERFYFDYGHASIADLGHVAICFEDISELAGIEVFDEQLLDGQARSSRYQEMGSRGFCVPGELDSAGSRRVYERALDGLTTAYHSVHAQAMEALERRHPRPGSMKRGVYQRNLAARAYDLARYLLPLATPTSLGLVLSIRTVEKQISRLMASPYSELQGLGSQLREVCGAPPDMTWPRLQDEASTLGPLAPTLARHARPSEFVKQLPLRARRVASRVLEGVTPQAVPDVELIPPHPPEVELAATLLYSASRHPYSQILETVQSLSREQRQDLVDEILDGRGPFDEMPRAARCGYRFIFDVSMDVGGWRDLHRHRRCQQVLQPLDLNAGLQVPPSAVDLGVVGPLKAGCEAALEAARLLAAQGTDPGERAAHYLLPFAHRVRCLFKMDLGEAHYLVKLRTGVKGHESYRSVAWQMGEALKAAEPSLARLIEATSPDVEDPLTR